MGGGRGASAVTNVDWRQGPSEATESRPRSQRLPLRSTLPPPTSIRRVAQTSTGPAPSRASETPGNARSTKNKGGGSRRIRRPRGGNRAPRIHAKVRYRCFLPDLAGFTSPRYPDPVTATTNKLAERQGFEPWVPLRIHTRSRRAPSTARSPLRNRRARPDLSARPAGCRHAPGKNGGERGIRTPGTVPGTPDFESGAFDQLGQLSARTYSILAFFRLPRKNIRRRSPHSSARIPPTTSTRWFSRGSVHTS